MKETKKICQTETVSQNDLDVGAIVDGLVEDEILTEEQAQNATIVIIQQEKVEDEIVEEEIIEIGKYSEEELQQILSEYKAQIASSVSNNGICDIQGHLYILSNGYVMKGYSYTMTEEGINAEFGTQIEPQTIMNKPFSKWSVTDSLILILLVLCLLYLFHEFLFKK